MKIDSNTRRQLTTVVLVVIGLSLLFRLADMTFSEMNWGSEDYVAAAALLAGGGVSFVLASRSISDWRSKRRLALAVLTVLALTWGLLATDFDGFNF